MAWFKDTKKMYTAAEVHAEVTAITLAYLAELEQYAKRASIPETIRREASILSAFNLRQSKNAQFVEKAQMAVNKHNEMNATLTFMQMVWEKFGKDVMVVRLDHFFKILEKYDLVCGKLDRYTGSVPQSALDTLTRLDEMWTGGEFPKECAMRIVYAEGFSFNGDKEELAAIKSRCRMPMSVSDKEIMRQIGKLTRRGVRGDQLSPMSHIADGLFIAAPAADMKPLRMVVSFPSAVEAGVKALRRAEQFNSDLRRFPNVNRYEREDIVNQATRKEKERLQGIIERSDLPRYCELEFVKTQPLPKRVVVDPFICSLTPYGVMIHAKWGEEAEDEMIKRYEELSNTING